MTLTIKRDGNWSSFQLANSALPLSVTSSAIAPSARMKWPAGGLAAAQGAAQAIAGVITILAEGAIALSVTLSGGALFAS